MVLYPDASCRKPADGGVRLGRGCVTATAAYRIFRIEHSLLRYTDNGTGFLYARKDVVNDCTALVKHERGGDAVLLEKRNYIPCTVSVNLLVTGKGEPYIIFRHEAILYQKLGSGENGIKRALGIDNASAPEDSVLYNSVEGRFFPLFLLTAYYVVMRHKDRWVTVVLALPSVKERSVADARGSAGLMNVRKKAGEQLNELLELTLIVKGGIGMRNGAASYHLGKVLCRLLFRYLNPFGNWLVYLFGLKFQCAYENYKYKCEKQCTDYISYHLYQMSPFL